MELFKAHKQWATRPADERFASLEDLYAATRGYAGTAVEADVDWADLRVIPSGEELMLRGDEGDQATLTNWAMKQLCARVGAPSDYLAKLPVELAAQNLNHGLDSRDQNPSTQASLLLHRNGTYLVRAVTSDRYSRIWNHEVAERLLNLAQLGWEPARPDVRASMGDWPALYASDHDMFAMLRSQNASLDVNPDGEAPTWRGVIAENSEVGAGALKLTRFLYNQMCGNHIIWGASDVLELKVIHVGNLQERVDRWEVALKAYENESASEVEAIIKRAQVTLIADTKEGVLDKLFGIRALNIPRKTLGLGFDAVNAAQDGDPRSVWGMVQGLTRHSQTIPFADERTKLDRAAGRILEKVKF